MLELLTPITILATVVWLIGSICYRKSHDYWIAWCVSALNAISEIASFIAVGNNFRPALAIIYNLYFALHAVLWLHLLFMCLLNKKLSFVIALGTIFITAIIHFLYRGSSLNIPILILSCFVYVIAYGIMVIIKLRNEQIDFLTSTSFLLLSAPLLFMLSNVLNFGFFTTSSKIMDEVFWGLGLYEWINWTANLVYYGLLIWFFLVAGRFQILKNDT